MQAWEEGAFDSAGAGGSWTPGEFPGEVGIWAAAKSAVREGTWVRSCQGGKLESSWAVMGGLWESFEHRCDRDRQGEA